MPRDGDGLFRRQGVWSFKFKGPDGRYHEKSTQCRKHQDAQQYRRDFLRELAAGTLPSDMAKWPLDKALLEHLDHVRATRAKSSFAPEQSASKNLVRVLGGDARLDKIAAQHLIRYQTTRRNEGAGPKTINNELSVLIRTLQLSNLWRRLRDTYRPLAVPETEVGVALTHAELANLIETAKRKPRWFVAWNTALLVSSTGLRYREIKTLRLRDICLDKPYPTIALSRVNTKTNASARTVPLNDHAAYAAAELMKRAELLGANSPEHFLLPANLGRHTKSGDPLNGGRGYDPSRHQETWASAWESLKKAAGLPNLRFHDLRHTFITHAASISRSSWKWSATFHRG